MKVKEAIEYMTRIYLHRVIDSFTKDLPKGDEDKSRNLILKNIDELTDSTRIRNVLGFEGIYSEKILLFGILEILVNEPEHQLSEEDIIIRVQEAEQAVISESESPNCLKYEEPKALEIFRAVLDVALEDEKLTSQELRLLHRLREKIGLSEGAKRHILAQMNHYPRAGNRIHTRPEFSNALINLQRRGVLLYCNKLEGGRFFIPEEIVQTIRTTLEIELSSSAWQQLLQHLSKAHLNTFLEFAGLPKSGTKEEQRERVISAGLKPSKALDSLSSQDLYDICAGLPGAKLSGTKSEKIDRIINYFANLVKKSIPNKTQPGELYYQFLTELAARDRNSLFANHVIKKDIDIERAFEEGTRYLFTEKLGLDLIKFSGNDHPDGGFRLKRSKDLVMWDNKSKETKYDFPPAHLKQFKRYIRDSHERVSCFLVIVPEIESNCEENAFRLKVESGSDTDIALITAEDLAWVAEKWNTFNNATTFDPEVFNHTGILTSQILKQRMKLFL